MSCTGLDESEEINACTVKVKVDVDGQDEDWLFLFKNETHNHPTEIEPFGGAATCIGGCIRDPLSGRSYVYQAMRVTGAGGPDRAGLRDAGRQAPPAQARDHRRRRLQLLRQPDRSGHRSGRRALPPRLRGQAHGGGRGRGRHARPTTCAAKRPAPGDKIILLGGRTGRDGIGGATGSSKAHNVESLATCGAEVQKGNAPVERKLQRLFRDAEACRLIKRCNDFGAGGVSVAIGELADGLDIDLERGAQEIRGPGRHRACHLRIPGAHGRGRCAGGRGASSSATPREENLEATVDRHRDRGAAHGA